MPSNDGRVYRLKHWWRGKVTFEDCRDVAHARQLLATRRASGAVVLYMDVTGINAGTWFLYMILK